MKEFTPMLFTTLKGYNGSKLVKDIVAGIIVAIIALPLSIALAIASGVGPEEGLYTAIIAGFVIAALGGSRVNISGPTAAFATIVAGIVAVNTLFFSGRGDAHVVSVANCVGAICSEEFIAGLGTEYSVEIIQVHDNSIEKGYIISQSPAPGEERRIIGSQTVKLVLTVSLGAQQAVMKDYTLWDSREAEIELRTQGFGVKIVEQNHATIPDGCVISSHPISGVTINKGDVIILYVSSGETVDYTYIPDLVNKNEAQAYDLLLQYKVGIGTVTYVRSSKPAGTVLSQSIKAGERVPVTLTKINVVISGGPNYTDAGNGRSN